MATSEVLAGKVALVTGGGLGIGLCIARGLAQSGAQVVVADVDLAAAEQTASRLQDEFGTGVALHADVTRGESVRSLMSDCAERAGGIDILVNNAGVYPIAPITSMTEDEWDRVMAINLKGTFLCSQAVLPYMRRRGAGRIINLGSVSGLAGAVGMAHYAASKGGVVAFTKSLAREVAAMGITANVVAPGIVENERTRQIFPEVALQSYIQQTPLRRLAYPYEVAGAVVFLCTKAAAYITGQVYTVDGGFTMQ